MKLKSRIFKKIQFPDIYHIHILGSVHSLTLSLSRAIQSKNQDLDETVQLADARKKELMIRRENAKENFEQIFQTVTVISKEFDIELQKPRIATKQTQRFNVPTDSVSDYYRISIYIYTLH